VPYQLAGITGCGNQRVMNFYTFAVALLFDAVLVALGRAIMPWSHLAKQPEQAGV